MVILLLSFLSVSLFCLCAHQFIKHLVTPMPAMNFTHYSRLALKVKRNYEIFAWAVMTFAFLVALVISFYQVFVEL